MLEYLIEYGVEKHNFNIDEVDINDRLALQEQINHARFSCHKLLVLADEIQNKILECSKKLGQRSKKLILENNSSRINQVLNSDDEYLTLDAELQALKSGLNMVNSEINFYQTDLRILNSVFYNKF